MKANRVPWMMVLVACLTFATIAPAAETVKPLIVGMELTYPPFEMTDPQGKPPV